MGPVRRGQRDDLQNGRGFLLGRHALLPNRVRQLRLRRSDSVLDQDLRKIGVCADLEGHDQRIDTVIGSRGGHVDHVLDPVDLLFDRQGHGVHDHLGTRPRIKGRHLHRRRRDRRIHGDRQVEDGNQPHQNHDPCNDVGKNGAADEELGEQIPLFRLAPIETQSFWNEAPPSGRAPRWSAPR